MSAPSSSLPSSSSVTPISTRPPAQGKPPDLTTTVLSNLHNLLQMDQVGKLSAVQQTQVRRHLTSSRFYPVLTGRTSQLRQLIITQTKPIVLHALLQSRPNPLLDLPRHLDPTQPWEHGPAIIAKDKFEQEIASAVGAANAHVQRNGLNRALPHGVFSLAELRDMLKVEAPERAIMLEKAGLPLHSKGITTDEQL